MSCQKEYWAPALCIGLVIGFMTAAVLFKALDDKIPRRRLVDNSMAEYRLNKKTGKIDFILLHQRIVDDGAGGQVAWTEEIVP